MWRVVRGKLFIYLWRPSGGSSVWKNFLYGSGSLERPLKRLAK